MEYVSSDIEALSNEFSGTSYRLFDSHAHYLDSNFDEDRDQLIPGLPLFGVRHIVECSCHVSDMEKVVALQKQYPDIVFGALGIHAEQADEFSTDAMDHLRSLLSGPGMVAVGEIGLDYHYDDNPPKSIQRECFDTQLSIASEFSKPVLIHDRDAHGDTMDLLRAHRQNLSGVMHCFSGSYETAKECLDLGLYIGIGGSSTFKNSKKLMEIIPKLPPDRILLETDCPYMAPEPFRGHRNDSRFMHLTLKNLSSLRPESTEELAAQCYRNCLSMFRLDS